MTIQELFALYEKLEAVINNTDVSVLEDSYLVDSNTLEKLYYKLLHGKAGRKEFLIFAISDMLHYLESNGLEKPKSSLLVKFNRCYSSQIK